MSREAGPKFFSLVYANPINTFSPASGDRLGNYASMPMLYCKHLYGAQNISNGLNYSCNEYCL